MSLEAKQFLDSARAQCAGETEVEHRNCASRAYYAAFHSCLKWVQPLADSPAGAGLHGRLIIRLKGRADTRAAALMLARTRDFQLEADYNLDSHFSRQQACEALELAAAVLQAMAEIRR